MLSMGVFALPEAEDSLDGREFGLWWRFGITRIELKLFATSFGQTDAQIDVHACHIPCMSLKRRTTRPCLFVCCLLWSSWSLLLADGMTS